MAYRPSKRARRSFEIEPPNIAPMMNLMVVLIPLLLTSAEFVRLGVIELNLPPAATGPDGTMLNQMPIESQKKLDLTVTVTDRGFFISSSMAVLSGSAEGGPTIPLVNGAYDYRALSLKLYEIKQRAVSQFSDANHIILMAEPNVDYQTIVSTMDASRALRLPGRIESLFPDVSLSAGVF
ncbi:biopolymer transporter ExbD [bacterium]|nr:biopolymer transporter ExbD [bacterium]